MPSHNYTTITPDLPTAERIQVVQSLLNDTSQIFVLPLPFLRAFGAKSTVVAAYLFAGMPVPVEIRSEKALAETYFRCPLFEKKPVYTAQEAADILCKKSRQQTTVDSLFVNECEWCRADVPVVHAHHHPIPKSKGGTETGSICPNCHAEYHFLVQPRYCLTEFARDVFAANREYTMRTAEVSK